jgi:hypothetical protein
MYLPIDLASLLRKDAVDKVKPDTEREPGRLYCSSDLVGSLRHAMLREAGVPQLEESFASLVRLETGNLWHEWFSDKLLHTEGLKVEIEVPLSDYLPGSWGGRADWLFWSEDKQAYILGDLKTCNGNAMPYIVKNGMKEAHRWQLSAYWYALNKAGYPLLKGFFVLYFPVSEAQRPNFPIVPHEIWDTPIEKNVLRDAMYYKDRRMKEYLEEVSRTGEVLNDLLQPEPSRVFKLFKRGDKYDVKLVPHWSSVYCPYDTEYCGCKEIPTTKVGEYVLSDDRSGYVYVPRKGYEDVTDVPDVNL